MNPIPLQLLRRQLCDNFPQLVKILSIQVQNRVAINICDCVFVPTIIESKLKPRCGTAEQQRKCKLGMGSCLVDASFK